MSEPVKLQRMQEFELIELGTASEQTAGWSVIGVLDVIGGPWFGRYIP